MPHNVRRIGEVYARRRVTREIVIVVAAVVTGLAWVVGRLAGVDYIAQTPLGTGQVSLGLTVIATVLAGLAGWGVIGLLERYSTSAQAIWTALALVVLALSIVPVFATPSDLASRLTLSALHCVAATILIPGLSLPAPLVQKRNPVR